MKYAIYTRYQHHSKEGKVFTEWFRTDKLFFDESEANDRIKYLKSFCKDYDKKTKLNHEYEVRYIDETLLPQIRLKRPKGRPKKIGEEELNIILSKLFKSKTNSVKIDLLTARYLYNDNANVEYIKNKISKKYNGEKYPVFWYDEINSEKVPYILLKDKNF